MQKALAFLTILVVALPGLIGALWWAAFCSQILRRVPAGDAWETALNARLMARAGVVVAMAFGCVAIIWFWSRFAGDQLDAVGLRSLVNWAFGIVTAG